MGSCKVMRFVTPVNTSASVSCTSVSRSSPCMANPRPLPARPRPLNRFSKMSEKPSPPNEVSGPFSPTRTGLPARLFVGLGLLPVGAILIVFFPFIRVAQDFVRGVQLLEFFFHLGFLGAAMHVGMELARKAAIGLLDIIRRGRLRKTENLIVVALCCCHGE